MSVSVQFKRAWARFSEKPVVLLTRLFVGRVFHGNGPAEGGLQLGMGLLLALLPLPGGFYAVFLFEKYSTFLQWMRGEHLSDPAAAALPEQYFFVVLSMVVTGVVAVWRWDSIFPDRRDYANLAPLPLHTTATFFANLLAIGFFASVLAVYVNAASGLLFPLAVGAYVDSFPFFLHFLWVHIRVVVLASLFSFFSVFLLIGLLMLALPYAAFRRISLVVRSAFVAALVALLTTSFAVPLALRNDLVLLRFLPSVWFLGLCRRLQTGDASVLAGLGRNALLGAVVVVPASFVVYASVYRARFLRIPEHLELTSAASCSMRWEWIFRLLDRTVLRTAFQRTGYRFILKTLLRSELHSLIFGASLGLGMVVASQFLAVAFSGKHIMAGAVPSPELLALPLIVSYCILIGLRISFSVPKNTEANWIFRFLLDKTRHECASTAMKSMLSFVLPWAFAVVLPVYTYLWGWQVGLLQLAVVTIWTVLLAQILLLRFRTLPFTCQPPPFRESAVVLGIACLLGFFVFVVMNAQLEYWAISDGVARAVLVVVPLGTWYLVHLIRQDTPEIDRELRFEQGTGSSFELLDLTQGS